ncbi:hypothetical protein GBAR_LOCUS21998, partial [Geodia barretti]
MTAFRHARKGRELPRGKQIILCWTGTALAKTWTLQSSTIQPCSAINSLA